ncbi:MAG: pentapeptide repeat-containing protein [Natronohydrobacter sp.]|nr:pentapeptide repeat-containing protein [Natronohydrobacter sp.]
MNTDPVTLPFLTWQTLYVLLGALCFLIAAGSIWLILKGPDRMLRSTVTRMLQTFVIGLGVVWLWLLIETLLGLWQVFYRVEHAPLAGGSLGLGALIAAFLGAPFVVYGTWLRHKTNRLEQEGHITDRITKAIEQLGAEKTIKEPDGEGKTVERTVPNIEVRMGAILSLERIAQDSTIHDKGRDHVRVMEILCAYIRENSNARKPVDFPLAEWLPLLDGATEEERAEHQEWRKARFPAERNPLAWNWARTLPKPRADVQLALTVIGRRNPDQLRVEAAWPQAPTQATVWPFVLAFKRVLVALDNQPASEGQLPDYNRELHSWKTSVDSYRGYRLDLRGANLQGADMAAKQPGGSDAVFSGALLADTRMEGAAMRATRIEGSDLLRAVLVGADLAQAKISGARLLWAQLEGAALWDARVEAADFRWTKMEGTAIGLANLRNAYLRGAVMNHRTSIDGASLIGAALRELDCVAVLLVENQVKSCFGDASVVLPEGVSRPAHWADWKLADHGEHAFEIEWRKWQANPDTYRPPPKPE